MTSVSSTTLHGLDPLRRIFGGEIHAPGDPGYGSERKAWNLSVEQRPALIAVPRTADDVARLVRWARSRGLRVAPQATGHNAAPMRGLERTVLLRTGRMRRVELDVPGRRARAEAGAFVTEVLDPASGHGLGILSGSSPNVSLVGYALGGGIGFVGRRHGLCANTVTAIEAVLADGTQVRCDRDEHPDLFWALRGGGGNFAIVTAIELELVPMPELSGGGLMWPWERAQEILNAWADWTRSAPESATTTAMLLQVPPLPDIPEPLRGRRFVRVDGAILAGEAEAREILAPLLALGPELDMFTACEPAFLSRLHMDPEDPTPMRSGNALLEDVTPQAVDDLLSVAGPGSRSPLAIVEMRHFGGAAGRVPEGAGALGRVPAEYGLFTAGRVMEPSLSGQVDGAVDRVLDAPRSVRSGSVYLNLSERPADVAASVDDETFTRLRAVKAAYDPDDLIQANHPIAPA
jgi:hypothetical protein